MKSDFYLAVNQNHCDNSVGNIPWIFFFFLPIGEDWLPVILKKTEKGSEP